MFLIGLNKYKFAPSLNSCVKDCRDIKDIMIKKYGFDEKTIVELYDDKATKSGVLGQLKRYADELNIADSLIIYYSGHGSFVEKYKMGFWIPYEGNNDPERIVHGSCISNEEMLKVIKKIRAKHVCIISDSCFSRSILMCEESSVKIGSGVGDDLMATLSKSMINDEMDYDEFPSRWALTAGSKEIQDGKKGENSPFAKAILYVLSNSGDRVRIGTLIEYVKRYFEENSYQKPQGYPLKDAMHKGGEYIFKALNINSRIKYDDILSLLRYYKRNSRFELVYEYESNKDSVIYDLYAEYDAVIDKSYYFLVLGEKVYLGKTHEHFKKKCGSICDPKELIILLPKERDQRKPELRRRNVEAEFSPLQVFYIEDFMRDHCSPKMNDDFNGAGYLTEENFVLPTFEIRTDDKREVKRDFWFIENWMQRRYSPVLVITGAGGIGKTTFADYIADKFKEVYKNIVPIYIEAKKIVDKLNKRGLSDYSFNIFDFYEEYKKECDEDKVLNGDLFGKNLDASNIFVVVDGLDEIISRFDSFNVDSFLNSIVDISNNLGYGKVVITCRTHFWNKSKYYDIFEKGKVVVIEMLPFDSTQIKEYFGLCFDNDKKKVEKAEGISKDFVYPDDRGKKMFHPFVLDVIRNMIDRGYGEIVTNKGFFSDYLCVGMKKDYIIYRMLEREVIRIGQISVDDQVKLFVYISINNKGIMESRGLNSLVCEAVGRHVDSSKIEAIKSHPFFDCKGDKFLFRYDFLCDYFKGIYITRFFRYGSECADINSRFIEIVSDQAWYYNAPMCEDVASRFLDWSDDDHLKWSDMIKQLWELYDSEGIAKDVLYKCVSGVFSVSLWISEKNKGNNIENNTYIMKGLFGVREDVVSGMVIINMTDSSKKLRFDYSNCIIENSCIDNYYWFNECQFKKTVFKDSGIYNLSLDTNRLLPLDEITLEDCQKDNTVQSMYDMVYKENSNDYQTVILFLEKYFSLYSTAGRLQKQTLDRSAMGRDKFNTLRIGYSKINPKVMSFKDIMKLMDDNAVIKMIYVQGVEKAEITEEYRLDIVKFLKDGTLSAKIINLVDVVLGVKKRH